MEEKKINKSELNHTLYIHGFGRFVPRHRAGLMMMAKT